MQAISAGMSEKVRTNSSLLVKATMTLSNGSVIYLSGSDLKAMAYEQATSSDSSFDIGGAIVGKLTLTLENFNHRFDSIDFTDARVVPYVGAELSDGTTEWLRKGAYVVDQPDAYGDEIQLTCYDLLTLLSRMGYSEVGSVYPARLGEIINECCERIGVTFRVMDTSVSEALAEYEVETRPSNVDNLSALQVAAYAAQAAGCFLRCDNASGQIVAGRYDQKAFETETWLNGGSMLTSSTPYSDGDAADGGTFDTTTTPYSDGATADGGTFDSNQNLAIVYSYKSLTVGTDDAVVTGIQVTAQNEVVVGSDGSAQNGANGETALAGSKGYVLSVTGNPFVLYGHASTVANAIYSRVGGMSFRRFTLETMPNPSVEPGDPIVIEDRLSRVYRSYVTSVSLTVNGTMTLKCGGATPARNSSAAASAVTKAIVEARNDTLREKTAREIAQKQIEDRLDNTSGLYQTTNTLSDGSTVYFLHDKPTLAASKVVWKMTADAVGVSTDGGATYATGLTANGEAVLNRIYAEGINADYITTGTLNADDVKIQNLWKVGNDKNNVSVSVDRITGSASAKFVSNAREALTIQVDSTYSTEDWFTITSINHTSSDYATDKSYTTGPMVCPYNFNNTNGVAFTFRVTDDGRVPIYTSNVIMQKTYVRANPLTVLDNSKLSIVMWAQSTDDTSSTMKVYAKVTNKAATSAPNTPDEYLHMFVDYISAVPRATITAADGSTFITNKNARSSLKNGVVNASIPMTDNSGNKWNLTVFETGAVGVTSM
ncbi:hypothetical protein DW090_01630 [Olsenella sp. AM05-17]|uniref:hypothetical protein n=1 Tax=unclassified Olsenella TaxID=2638792 RepID=UPI000E4C37DD|nr:MULTISPECIES: hypothetical protein [unclassified Olsenella]RHJ96108.1 hypothetical protein DW092_00495 [Olsenella sp. AM05-7]RHK00459.1 hypothetical protein DW090_01630 [Olsenella sp. AM05-17]